MVAAVVAGAAGAAVVRSRVLAARQQQVHAARLRLALSGPGGIDHMKPDAFE
ncbi:hypothetical protein AB0C76_38455 [Kitasatospora sp. NPDC048722]|uniref:hypothetical protein n=1 Tax=Kitasatospora sp. NPDC048722 TaxID=3155639 RepID=UPI003411BCAE